MDADSFSLSQRSKIQVWLYEQVNMRIEGCIIVSCICLDIGHLYFCTNTCLDCPSLTVSILLLFPKGFYEYMNLVLDDAEEVHMKTKNRKPLGKSQ